MEAREFIGNLVMLILAAGLGRRMNGRSKPDLPWYKDGTLLGHQCAMVTEMGLLHLVVAGPGRAGEQIVTNAHPEQGLAESLKIGVQAIRHRYGSVAIGVLLADQPFIRVDDMRQVLQAFLNREAHIHGIRARYDNIPGHPVFFDPALDSTMASLSNDQGLGIAWKTRDDTAFIDLDVENRPSPAFDIDTEEDYALACRWISEGRA